MGDADFNQFMQLKNQPVIAAGNIDIEENLSSVLVPTRSTVMDEQLKLAHKVVHILDRPYRKVYVTLLRYNVDKPESSYAQVRLFAGKKEEEKFQRIVHEK